ncbi:TetR/AcrR family transcriptional regulator [Streptomyces sp. ISL-1]|uniref:TetR/AcrR family transcriptional regulator n=1 Tax=Streptomyces sp. ISL-1 TaxID=2817657 RepID=UPI001BEA7C54|nr:TetR/AcrR family transcriptional regulator [Streptomyces sp. ISL-1]MBT2388463.1 TetR/AcrR family transcriptional regulator [Streptomyces sp. ISL-1]
MGRLSRAELQQLNRAKVLAAARDEFAGRGFRDAKVDGIAERAGLTRGAVYSNFPGKRALYFAVLADLAERVPEPPALDGAAPDALVRDALRDAVVRDAVVDDASPEPPRPIPDSTVSEALGAFARAWVARLPLTEADADTDAHEKRGLARLGMHLMPEILADESIRRPFGQLLKLDAILLGLALERLRPADSPQGRLVRVAEAAFTTLYGATQLAGAAPGFIDPFNVVRACEQMAGLDLNDTWPPPYLRYTPHARPAGEPWDPPPAVDALRGEPARLADDGVVGILGLHRLEAAEELVRAAPPGATVTAVLVTANPGELAPLARLTVAGLRDCLRHAFPPSARPRLQVLCDDSGAVAAAAGVPVVSEATEAAVRIAAGRIVARADGRGACHAAAGGGAPHARTPRPRGRRSREGNASERQPLT